MWCFCARLTRTPKSSGSTSAAAKRIPGVIAVVTGQELAAVITPWVGVLSHMKGLKSAPQHAIAIDHVCWQGEAVAAIVATSRAVAEDAAELVAVEYEELEAVTDMRTALDPETPVIHASLGDNLAFERNLDAGEVDQAFADSDEVVEAEFMFGRHTGVTLEPRAVVADWNAAEARLTIYQGTQAPHMVQNIAALHLGLRDDQVRVVCKDVGGSFGIKVHIYADEMATYALSKLLRRPIKYVADRVESFNTDIHARDHRCKGRIGVKRDGTILAFEIDDLTGIGPYSMYPRTSAIEANQVVNLVGGPYTTKNYRARARVVFQNKNVMCQYRGVGHPVACSVTEGLVDLAAMKIGMDPVEIRRRNLVADDAYPCASPAGLKFELLSHHAAMNKLMAMMNYDALRAEQAELRKKNIHRGIGIASFIEITNPSAAFYGVGGAKISSQDGVAVRMDATGSVICQTSITEQGQGSESLTAQIVGSVLGVPMDRVRVILGDTDNTPYGGGTWASRGAGIGGEAALQAAKVLREQYPRCRGGHPAVDALRTRHRQSSGRQRRRRRCPDRTERTGADRLFPAGHTAAGHPAGIDGDAPFRAAGISLCLHQRRPGLLARGRHRYRLRQAAEALGGRGLRHHHQPATGRRADQGRGGAGPRRGVVRKMHL